MSTLKDLQTQVAAALNADAYLVQGGCMAFAEDTADVFAQLDRQLGEDNGVAISILTPIGRNQGGRSPAGMPLAIDALVVKCQERPMTNRQVQGHITALQAAQHIALELDQPACHFVDFAQDGDDESEVVSVSCIFKTSITLTDPATAGAQ